LASSQRKKLENPKMRRRNKKVWKTETMETVEETTKTCHEGCKKNAKVLDLFQAPPGQAKPTEERL
jgi:hypothetical protein